MSSRKSQRSDHHSNWIVIPAVTAITTAVSLGIFGISKSFEVGLSWAISLFVLYFVVQRIDLSKPYGNSKRIGMMLGIGISVVVVWWLESTK